MKIKILKPIKVTEVGKTVLPKDYECEVSDSCGKVLVKRKYAAEVEVKEIPKPKSKKKEVKKTPKK